VQAAIERYFLGKGFQLESGSSHADLECVHPERGERWVVEAKGQAAAVGVDFHTGLGQILQRMESPE